MPEKILPAYVAKLPRNYGARVNWYAASGHRVRIIHVFRTKREAVRHARANPAPCRCVEWFNPAYSLADGISRVATFVDHR